jgi:hypothetical protein
VCVCVCVCACINNLCKLNYSYDEEVYFVQSVARLEDKHREETHRIQWITEMTRRRDCSSRERFRDLKRDPIDRHP